MEIQFDRKYLGEVITSQNYKPILLKDGRDAIRFHQKHLRAYLKGKDSFTHGWDLDENGKKIRPTEHTVQQEITLNYLTINQESGFAKFASQQTMNNYLKNKFG